MPPKKVEKTRERPTKDVADAEDPEAHKNEVYPGVLDSFASRSVYEPYACTGKFHKDFLELCHKRGIMTAPQILLVPQPPVPTVVQHQQQEAKPEKGKKDKAAAKDKEKEKDKDKEKEKVEAPAPEQEQEEQKEPEFKTFAVRDNADFIRPTIFVEMEHPDKQETVTEMKIRGFKVDNIMLDIFQQCWPAIEKLTVVYFWNVGLTAETMEQLANAMPSCPNIKTLIVEGNPIPEENFYLLIEIENQVQNLLLRHNSIGDQGAAAIGHALGNPRRTNQRLLVLNLNGNVITDKGFCELIKGLRLNRCLLSLSVGTNFISDEGVNKLAEILSMFPLTHEEIVERRKLLSEQRSAERQKSRGENRRGDRPSSQTRSQSKEKGSRASSRKKEGKGGKDDKDDHPAGKSKVGKKDKDEKEKTVSKKGAADKEKTQTAKAAPAVTQVNKSKAKEKRGASAESQTPEKLESQNPLLDEAEPRQVGELWIPGNRILIMVNLSNNRITTVGVAALLKGLQYQMSMIEFLKSGTGLMRCNLQHNPIPDNDETYLKLQEHLSGKDPLQRRRPPSVPSATPVNTDPPGSLKSESRADGRRGRVSKDSN